MLRISIVGFGLMGQQHLKAIRAHPGCQVVSIIDNNDVVEKKANEESCLFYRIFGIKR